MIFADYAGAAPPPGRLSSHGAITLARLIAERRLRPDLALTCRGRSDGAGQQAMAVIQAMMVARYAGCRYRHSPFARMAHGRGAPEDWAARWERFLNLGEGESPVPADAELVPLSAVLAHPEAHLDRPVVICERLFGVPAEAVATIGEALRGTLRARYWRSPKPEIPSHRAPAGLTVAIHLRRGDVNGTTNRHRFVRDEAVLRQIARLRRALAWFDRPCAFNLYSEGNPADFAAFAEAGCVLHVGTDPFETLHNMIMADVLLAAPSNFSYVAGFLSRGITLDHRRRAPPFADWLRRRADGDIPVRGLRRALLGRMSWREHLAHRLRRWRRRALAGWRADA